MYILDTSCQIENGQIVLDLYRKPTDRNLYLMLDSCHPPACQKKIPYSLAMIIVRICTYKDSREFRFKELEKLLMSKGYPKEMVTSAINRAKSTSREQALRCVVKPSMTKGPIFVVSWDPRLPSISNLQNRHWRSMITLGPYLKEVFPKPPLLTYKGQRNIGDIIN